MKNDISKVVDLDSLFETKEEAPKPIVEQAQPITEKVVVILI